MLKFCDVYRLTIVKKNLTVSLKFDLSGFGVDKRLIVVISSLKIRVVR